MASAQQGLSLTGDAKIFTYAPRSAKSDELSAECELCVDCTTGYPLRSGQVSEIKENMPSSGSDSSDDDEDVIFVLSRSQEDQILAMLNTGKSLKKILKQFRYANGTKQAEAVKSFVNARLHPPKAHPSERKTLLVKTRGPTLPLYHYESKEDPLEKYFTFLVMGETGSGKTTLLDAIVNYLSCMQHTDTWRWKLVDENHMKDKHGSSSQTTEITYYFITDMRNEERKIHVKIIDTPGFGDTGGIKVDEKNVKKFENLFKSEIQELDYILLVVKAGETRWTPANRYVYDRVQEMFGNDAKDRFILMCTFADGAEPVAVETLRPHVHFQVYFPFNNSALYVPSEMGNSQTKFYWNMAMSSVEQFLNYVLEKDARPMSLTLSVDVLDTRKYLYELISSAQWRIKAGFNTLEQSRKLLLLINENREKINANGKFTYEEVVEELVRSPLGNTYQACGLCQITCCQVCTWPSDATESRCTYFNGGRGCPKCPGQCPKSAHIRTRELIRKVSKTVTKEWSEKKKALQAGEEGLSSAQRCLNEKRAEMDQTAKAILNDMEAVKQSLRKLDEIAMKPRIFTNEEYFTEMIKHEEETKNPGYQDRVEGLKMMAARAQEINKINKADSITDLFPSYQSVIEQTMQHLKSGAGSSGTSCSIM